jgi:hypothetical protein
MIPGFGENRGASLSDDGVYRYLLWRQWNSAKPFAHFIMLNPSTADATVDDPTVRRCAGFARAWGLGGIRVTNLYPFRATKPDDLWNAAIPEGQHNMRHIAGAVDGSDISVAAWGIHGRENRIRLVRNLFGGLGVPLYCLGLTKDGAPRHPLYVAGATVPVIYEPSGTGLEHGSQWSEMKEKAA